MRPRSILIRFKSKSVPKGSDAAPGRSDVSAALGGRTNGERRIAEMTPGYLVAGPDHADKIALKFDHAGLPQNGAEHQAHRDYRQRQRDGHLRFRSRDGQFPKYAYQECLPLCAGRAPDWVPRAPSPETPSAGKRVRHSSA